MKKLKTKKKGDYKIITFAARGELMEWLESKPKLSEFIRDILIKQMMEENKYKYELIDIIKRQGLSLSDDKIIKMMDIINNG